MLFSSSFFVFVFALFVVVDGSIMKDKKNGVFNFAILKKERKKSGNENCMVGNPLWWKNPSTLGLDV